MVDCCRFLRSSERFILIQPGTGKCFLFISERKQKQNKDEKSGPMSKQNFFI
ncbi:Os04g0415050 [Oryza sativa Japonica Group]|uniref:Os04g0415050 protein n=1 Tax=Oryza sativa subsp. japonica TaxID=39947 RepID=C7J1B4_ORYSJ|nr:Os04g0415050 [Oryza sativa Japonica Group]|eukprot:NP_001173927.1 Os04g0415050 [Oryza sativa Japonica Group]